MESSPPKRSLSTITVSIFVVLILGRFCLPACAGAALTIDAQRQFDYASALFVQGDYSAAVMEYRRFIHFFPDDVRVPDAQFHIGLSLLNDHRYKQAIDAFQTVIDSFEASHLAVQSHFKISEAYLVKKDFGAAILALQNLLTATSDNNIADKAHYRLGWIYIEMGAWDRAREQFSRIIEPNRIKYDLEQLSYELEQAKQIKRKSPRLAGVLSIIPGGGFAYTGRYQDALMAFVVNGALIWAAYEAFDNDLPALGTCVTIVGFGFYVGNIYGGVNSAHKYNYKQNQNFIDQLKNNTKISLGVDRNGDLAFAINYRF